MSVRILVGSCLDVLRTLPDASVQTCVTSPPYWGLRDYGTGEWEGGKPACQHRGRPKPQRDTRGKDARGSGTFAKTRGTQGAKSVQTIPVRDVCKCGARRVDAQLGLERTPDEYVRRMVEVFREVRRVLRKDGTLWLNIGDSYSAHEGQRKVTDLAGAKQQTKRGSTGAPSRHVMGLKAKDLVGIPWMLAFALRGDGWYLRSDNIWHKPNPMPESVRDRPTKAHEYVFLFSKSERYYYDADAVAEPLSDGSMLRLDQNVDGQNGSDRAHGGDKTNGWIKAVVRSGNKSRKHRADFGGPGDDVNRGHQGFGIPWASNGSHRPQYKRALEIALAKGLTPAHLEAISACGFFGDVQTKTRLTQNGTANQEMLQLAREAKDVLGGYYREFLQRPMRNRRSVWTITTKPFKGAHFATMPSDLATICILAGAPIGGMVLDPFGGAGTTGLVADRNSRDATLIELNPAYAAMARERIDGDAPLFAKVARK